MNQLLIPSYSIFQLNSKVKPVLHAHPCSKAISNFATIQPSKITFFKSTVSTCTENKSNSILSEVNVSSLSNDLHFANTNTRISSFVASRADVNLWHARLGYSNNKSFENYQ